MSKKILKLLMSSSLLAASGAALAVPFNSIDPRSMAMGGAGVAVGDSSMAPFFNPALLTVTRKEDDFSLDLPIIGVRVYDPSEFRTSMNNFQNGNYINNLQNSINAYNAPGGQNTPNLQAIATNVFTLSTQFATLSDKPVQGEAGVGMVVGIPSKSYGGAFYADGWAAVGGVIHYRDDQNLQGFVTATNDVIACNGNPVCLNGLPASDKQYFDTTTGQVTFNTNGSLKSSVDVRGVLMTEVGLALSHEFGSGKGAWGFGITPKVVRTTLIDYSADVNSGNTSNATGSDYTTKYSNVNFDLGLAKDYGNGWRTGFVIKNIISHSYDFKRIATGAPSGSAKTTTGSLDLKPQARVGASHSTSWSTVAMDLDLTTNDPAGLENQSQYLSLGGELNAWDWMQLRLGYRSNLKDSARNVASVGVGIAPFGVLHFDLTAAFNSNEKGAAARLAFTF